MTIDKIDIDLIIIEVLKRFLETIHTMDNETFEKAFSHDVLTMIDAYTDSLVLEMNSIIGMLCPFSI